MTVIRQVWQEEGLAGKKQQRVMSEEGAAESDTGNIKVSGEPRGETKCDWYDELEKGDSQLGR